MLSLSDFRATARIIPTRFAAPSEAASRIFLYNGPCFLQQDAAGWTLILRDAEYCFRDQRDAERDLYFYRYVWDLCPPRSRAELSALLTEYCGAYGFVPRCALEMLSGEDLSERQSEWLHTFLEYWDRLEEPRTEDQGVVSPRLLTRGDRAGWLDVVWEALWGFRDDCISEGDPMHDEQWENICTAMEWIAEELGVDQRDLA